MNDKEESREIRQKIRSVLMNEWDPIGVKDVSEAAGEYDSYLGDVYRLVVENAPASKIANYLRHVEVDRMGLTDAQGTPLLPDNVRYLRCNLVEGATAKVAHYQSWTSYIESYMMQATAEIADRISTISVSSTLKVSADADRLRREGVDVVDFGAGEPDFPTPANIKEAAIQAITANFTKYTNAGGTPELRQAICDRHRQDFGTNYSPSECMVTVGGKHAIFNLIQALINPGDEVIIPVPYWVTYKDVVNYAGGVCVFVETNENTGFEVNAAMIERHLTPKTKLVIINSPSNPSGAVLSKKDFRDIFDLASKRDIFLMTDECYCHFLYDAEPFSIAAVAGAKDTVVVAGSLSKTYAMTGWRIGFALAPAPIIGAMMKLQSHCTSNPTSIAQKAGVEALRGPQESVPEMLAEYRRRRDFVVQRLRKIPGVSIVTPKGAFYAYPNISVAFRTGRIKNSLDFSTALLEEAHVAVVPGEAFGTQEHVRISYATSMAELERGLDRIHRFIEDVGR